MKPALMKSSLACIWGCMTQILAFALNLDDRARLRERFYGATRTVLAQS